MQLDLTRDDHAHLAARLAESRIGWLATTRRDGQPRSVPVWFAWTGETVVIFSGADTAKLGHLRRDPRCAFTLETADDGNDVVLVEAVAEFADAGADVVHAAERVLADKYALGDGLRDWRAQFSVPLVLRPTRVVAWSKPDGAVRYTLIER